MGNERRAADPAGTTVSVVVAYAIPSIEALVAVTLPVGAVVADAVAASGLLDRYALDPRMLGYAIFGQRARPSTPLVAGDRVELTRPLVADPKDARRRRAAQKPQPRARLRAKSDR